MAPREVDVLASERHYLEHLAPVWLALEHRGAFHVPDHLRRAATGAGIDPAHLAPLERKPTNPTVVASITDLERAGNVPLILGQHGAGQSYSSRHPSYPGGRGLERVAGFLVPNEQAATRFRRYYPRHPIEVIGSPILDAYDGTPRRPHPTPIVAVSWHWPCSAAVESGTAWPELGEAVLEELLAARAAGDVDLVGHAHPRTLEHLEPIYRRRGIPVLERFADVADVADVYVIDNSSTAFEAAAMGIAVVLVNAPSWRRHVEHGLRFWSAAGIGPHVNEAADVRPALARALDPDDEALRSRSAALEVAYARLDHQASRRAAAAIMGIFNASPASCGLCGAKGCSCGGPTTDSIRVIDVPRRTMAKTRGPVRIYRTRAGDFRLNEDDAKRRGLIPDGDRLPAAVARRLLNEARLPAKAVAVIAKRYAELDDDERAAALLELAMAKPRDLVTAGKEALEDLDLDDLEEVEEEDLEEVIGDEPPTVLGLGAEDEPPVELPPPAPTFAMVNPGELLEGRVGDVTDYLDGLSANLGEDVAKAAAGELLDLERAGKARTSLVAELERRAQ